MKDDTTYVYIIHQADKIDPIKIGLTNSLFGRLQTIQTGSPYPLKWSEAYKFANKKIARDVEREAHRACDEYRMEGEWFDLSIRDGLNAIHRAAMKCLQKYYRGNDFDDAFHEAITWNE